MGKNHDQLIEEVVVASTFFFEERPEGSLGDIMDRLPLSFSEADMDRHAKRVACLLGAAADRIRDSVGTNEAAAFLAVVSTGKIVCYAKDGPPRHSAVVLQDEAAESFERIREDYLSGRGIPGRIEFFGCMPGEDVLFEERGFLIERRGGLPEDVPLESVSLDDFQKIWELAREVLRISRKFGDYVRSVADENGRIPEELCDLVNNMFDQLLEQEGIKR